MERKNISKLSELIHVLDEKNPEPFEIPPLSDKVTFCSDDRPMVGFFTEAKVSQLNVNYLLARAAAGDFSKKEIPYQSVITHFMDVSDYSTITIGTVSRWITFTVDGVFIGTISAYPSAIMIVHAHIFSEESMEIIKKEFDKQKTLMIENCNVGWIDEIHSFEPLLVTKYKSMEEMVINFANYCLFPGAEVISYAPMTAPHLKKPSKRVLMNFLETLVKGENPFNFPKIPKRVDFTN